MLFALVAGRALAPSSKLAAARWISEDVLIEGLPATSDDACYRAMDWLLQVKDALVEGGLRPGRELAEPGGGPAVLRHHGQVLRAGRRGRPGAAGQARQPGRLKGEGRGRPAAFRAYGNSKDRRDDLPQIVIGMTATREAIPARVW